VTRSQDEAAFLGALYSFKQKKQIDAHKAMVFYREETGTSSGGASQTNREERTWQGINGERLAAEPF
jgi:hypothetical protein